MSSISVAGDVSGAISIAAPSAAGSGGLTLPTGTDTLVGKATTDTLTNKTLTSPTITGATITVAATAAPAFSVSSTALVSSTVSTFTKITYDTEDFDTNSNFASSRFTPAVAGYYQFNATIAFSGIVTAGTKSQVTLYKNGSRFLDGNLAAQISGETTFTSVAGIIYLNGSTDYVEVFGFQTAGTQNIGSAQSSVKFTGAMVRSA